MKAKEFEKMCDNAIITTKNSLIAILVKLFNENHNRDYEVVFKEQTYYAVTDGFCFPKRMFLNENHKITIERDFDWNDCTTDWEEKCVDDMNLEDLVLFCNYISADFDENVL